MINIRTIVTAKETLAAPKIAPNGRCSLTMIFAVTAKGDKAMSKYIDAVKTAEIVSERHKIPLSELVDTFAEVPTADVKEVKHGKWIEDKKDSSSRCSICGWYTDYDYDYVTNNGLGNEDFLFCGHCGARMDGGVKE